MKVCIDGIIKDIAPPDNEPVVESVPTIEDELAEIKAGVALLQDMLKPLINKLGG